MSDNKIVVSTDDGNPEIELSPIHFANPTLSDSAKSHVNQPKKRISLHAQLQDISYRIDLHEWLVENQCVRSFTQIHHNHNGGIFMAADGILRYENTWLPAEVEAENKIARNGSSYLFQKTGCYEMTLILRSADGNGDGSADLESQHATMIRFLGDWEKLWSIFAENQSGSDFLRRHIPLLRVFIAFFFHKRTAQTLIGLILYNLVLFQVYHQVSGTASSIGFLISAGESLLIIALYTAFYRLYKGSIWSMITLGLFDAKNKFKNDNEAAPTTRNERPKSSANAKEYSSYTLHDIHWTGAMRQVLSVTYSALCGNGGNTHTSTSTSAGGSMDNNTSSPIHDHRHGKRYRRYDAETFDDLLNITLKFLTVYGAFQTNSIHFHRWSYRAALLSAVTLWPLVLIVSTYASEIPTILLACSASSTNNGVCLGATIYAGGSLFFLTIILVNCLFFGSVVVCLVGLCYGTEIAYWVTDSWMARFSSLRRVATKVEEQEKINILIDHVCINIEIFIKCVCICMYVRMHALYVCVCM